MNATQLAVPKEQLEIQYRKIYDDSAALYREACLARNEQKINQNLAIMRYLDKTLALLGEA